MSEVLDYKIKDLAFRNEDGFATMSFKVTNQAGQSVTSHASHRMLPHHLYTADEPVEIQPKQVYDLIGNATLFMMVTEEGKDSVVNVQFRPGPTPVGNSPEATIANASALAVIPSLMKKNRLISEAEADKFTKGVAGHFGIDPADVSFTAGVTAKISPIR